jgi:hypothetical protein
MQARNTYQNYQFIKLFYFSSSLKPHIKEKTFLERILNPYAFLHEFFKIKMTHKLIHSTYTHSKGVLTMSLENKT